MTSRVTAVGSVRIHLVTTGVLSCDPRSLPPEQVGHSLNLLFVRCLLFTQRKIWEDSSEGISFLTLKFVSSCPWLACGAWI
jgi:hypothetical protein